MKQTIKVKRSAHFYLQIPKHTIRSILYVIHGYGQLAEDFLSEFKFLKESSTLVVAPEALSKFYNKDRKPAANWMTSHERLDEIDDYKNYLDELALKVDSEFGEYPIAVLGFSQGVSTVLRWSSNSKKEFHSIFLCSGTVPPELGAEQFRFLNKSLFLYYYGTNDKLLIPEKAKEQVDALIKFGLNVSGNEFAGRHEIALETKKELEKFSTAFDK